MNEEIQKMARKMFVQDKMATSHTIWIIRHRVKDIVPEGYADGHERFSRELEYGKLCEACTKLEEQDEDLPEACDECHPDCFFAFKYRMEFIDYAGVWFTKEACEAHIKARRYAYGDKAHSYGISMYRSHEMKMVMNAMMESIGEDPLSLR